MGLHRSGIGETEGICERWKERENIGPFYAMALAKRS